MQAPRHLYRMRVLVLPAAAARSSTPRPAAAKCSRAPLFASARAMSAAPACGRDAYGILLADGNVDRALSSPAAFKAWLCTQVKHWETNDAIYRGAAAVRDIKRANRDIVSAAERRLKRAEEAWQGCEAREGIEQLQKDIGGKESAVRNLASFIQGGTEAMAGAHGEEGRARLQAKLAGAEDKLAAFEVDLTSTRQVEAQATAACAEYLEREDALAAHCALWDELGISGIEAEVAIGRSSRGRSMSKAGSSFEKLAEEAVLALAGAARGGGEGGVAMLQGVTLGCSKAEIDWVIVRRGGEGVGGGVVEVLGVVEVKRNPNDVGYGFSRYQETLSWLCGREGGYDPAEYRTKVWTRGHFDREYVHVDPRTQEAFTFGPKSFRGFDREPVRGAAGAVGVGGGGQEGAEEAAYLRGLYFVTRPAHLHGLPNNVVMRISSKVATDYRLDLEREEDLQALWEWVLGLAGSVQTEDVLMAYQGSEDHIILV